MYSDEGVGTPVDDSTLEIFDSAVSFSDGMMTLEFTRVLNTGHNPLFPVDPSDPLQYSVLLWGIGPSTGSCWSPPMYHDNKRGIHPVSFTNPSLTFPAVMKCNL